jgi:hypothetical protein
MGEFQFSRYPCLAWDEELVKLKMGGLTIVASYVFWIHHEEEEGRFDWSGNRNIRYFVELCRRHGLRVLLRIGPFAHGEARNGALPDWLYGRPFKVRSNDEGYLAYVARYYRELGRQLAGLRFKDGGPIIAVQLDNEFMNTGAPWEVNVREEGRYHHFMNAGKGGVRHMRNLKRLALEAGIDVPLYTATAWGSPVPEGEILPVLGGVGFAFVDHRTSPSVMPEALRHWDASRVPFLTQEITVGMLQFYGYRPPYLQIPEYAQATTIAVLGSGCNLPGYYVYHGGSNPVGKHGYLNETGTAKISYDFEAPVREFGQIIGSYHRLRTLFLFLADFGATLAPTCGVYPAGSETIKPEDTETLRWCARADGDTGFLFVNNFQYRVDTQNRDDVMRPSIDIVRPSRELTPGERERMEAQVQQMPMPPHEGVSFRIRLPGGEARIPAAGGITVGRGVSAILPFNLPLGPGRLVASTCQPVCRITDHGDETFFFFAPQGFDPEYVLDGARVADPSGVRVEPHGAGVRVVPTPGTGCVFCLEGSGRKARIVTLTAEQAHRLWKFTLWGAERVALAPCGLLASDELLTLFSIGEPSFAFSLLAMPGERLLADGQPIVGEPDGVFTRYAARAKPVKPAVGVRMARRDKAVLDIPSDLLAGVPDVFLRIRYFGDVLNAFIDGELVSDHHCNGNPWEIGLKRFMPRAAEKGMYLYVTPLVKGTTVAKKIQPQLERAAGRTFTADETAEIVSIEAVPEYRVRIERA